MTNTYDKMDYRTKLEEFRNKERMEICNEWLEIAPVAIPEGTPPSRIMAGIAITHKMSAQNVEKILRAAGVYTGAKEERAKYEKQ